RAYNHYFGRNRDFFYYRVASGVEIDLVIETRKKTLSRPAELVLVEIKSARKWDKRWSEPMNELCGSKGAQVRACYGVYLGSDELRHGSVQILPLSSFLERLHKGGVY